jgi:hypothetical protein
MPWGDSMRACGPETTMTFTSASRVTIPLNVTEGWSRSTGVMPPA